MDDNAIAGIAAQNPSSSSLQAMIELVYVGAANNIITGQMTNLQNALTINQQVLNVLSQVQNLHNLVTANDKGTFNFDYASSQGGSFVYPNFYTSAASAFFGTPISVVPGWSAGNYQTLFSSAMIAAKSALSTVLLKELSGVTPLSGLTDPNSLYSTVKQVLADLSPLTTTGTGTNKVISQTAAATWVEDGYNATGGAGAASAGQIEQHITNAITAAESLNTTQTEQVQNYLYLFQEYYQSAGSILYQMTQILNTMAQNISSS